MRISQRCLIVAAVALLALLALLGTAYAWGPVAEGEGPAPAVAAAVTPIPWEGPTILPPYIGAPAKARPLPPPRVPQNPFMAPNPFNYVHNDPWMSDTYDVAGPLGREPEVWSSTLAAGRQLPDSYLFGCAGSTIDSQGRLMMSCQEVAPPGPTGVPVTAASLLLVDPVSLEVLTHMALPPPAPGTQQFISSSYLYLDNQDRAVAPVVEDGKVKIRVIRTAESQGQLSFEQVNEYDLSAYVPAGDNLAGLLPDWQGRIWFVVKGAATVGVLDPVAGSVKTLKLEGSITNSFAMDRAAAYVDTTEWMYRIELGPDGALHEVWKETYQNTGNRKPGQLSAGTGTTPTILGNGKYVAITDNAEQLHVVVYRTAAKLNPHENRVVCEVPVFKSGAGADDNSLIGSGLSLIAANCYGNELNQIWATGQTMPSAPGIARVDIDPNGQGCRLVWENDAVSVIDTANKMSTKTGLAYLVTRKYDTQVKPAPGRDVYYLSAVDVRTGQVVWERQLGTGFNFDAFEVVLLGPNGTAYLPQYGGLVAVRDTR